MARHQNHDDGDASSSQERSNTNASWSDLNHDVLGLVMMQLGVVDYISFRGVCKSWRLLACSNQNKFMTSKPPMSITISTDSNKKGCCYLEDFEERTFKTILPNFPGGTCVGLTCGYLIFRSARTQTCDFWLVNPITRKQLHFPDFPFYYCNKATLVFSPSISGWVFVVMCTSDIWFSVEGKVAWSHVSESFRLIDICAFSGTIYTLSIDDSYPLSDRFHVCELQLSPHPKSTILEIKQPDSFYPEEFVSSGENLYVKGRGLSLSSLAKLDVGEMKWVKPCEKTLMEEYEFFRSDLNVSVAAVKRESWADPQSLSHGRFALRFRSDDEGERTFFTARMWYFPHECI